jgi:hypothetical protein
MNDLIPTLVSTTAVAIGNVVIPTAIADAGDKAVPASSSSLPHDPQPQYPRGVLPPPVRFLPGSS